MLSLVRAGRPLKAEQISKRSGLKRPTVYAVMNRLVKGEAVSISETDRGTAWRPVPDHPLAVAATGMAKTLEEKAEQLLSSVYELAEAGKYEEALKVVDEALDLDREDPRIWIVRAAALISLKKYHEALEACDKAIIFDPEDEDAWLLRGYGLNELGRHKEALEAFDKSLGFKPDHAAAWNLRGRALIYLGRVSEALESVDKALTLKPNDHEFLSNRGLALIALRRMGEALEAFEKSISFNPNYSMGWHNRGDALCHLARFEEALASYDKAVGLRADYYETWRRRGVVLHTLGRDADALDSYDRALELKPDDEETLKAREDLLAAMGRRPEISPKSTRAGAAARKRSSRAPTPEGSEGMSTIPPSFKGAYIENAFFGSREIPAKPSKFLKDLLSILDLPVGRAEAADRFKGMSHDELLTDLVNWLRARLHKLGYTCRAVPGQGVGDEGVDARLRVISDEGELKIGIQVKGEGDAEKLSGKTQTQLLSGLSQAGVECMVLALCLPMNSSTQASISHLVGPVDSALDGRVIVLHPQTAAVLFERAIAENGGAGRVRSHASVSSIKGVLNIATIPLEEIEDALGERT